MKKSKIFMSAAVALLAAVSLASCEKTPQVAGSWTGNPQNLNFVSGAFTANSIDVLNFTDGTDGDKSGTIVISSMISAQQTVSAAPALIGPYQETVAATASVSGTWAFRSGEDDEIDIVLDYNTLKVNIDPTGVAFSQNFISGREQPQIDSLTANAVSKWQQSLSMAIRPYYSRYVRLDDVKVKDNILSLEVDDKELTFSREAK